MELREGYLYRCHYKCIDHYIPNHYLDPITLFRGPAGNMWPYNDPELGWKDIAMGGLKIIIIPASHLDFMDSQVLGVQFAQELRAAQEQGQSSILTFNSFLKECGHD